MKLSLQIKTTVLLSVLISSSYIFASGEDVPLYILAEPSDEHNDRTMVFNSDDSHQELDDELPAESNEYDDGTMFVDPNISLDGLDPAIFKSPFFKKLAGKIVSENNAAQKTRLNSSLIKNALHLFEKSCNVLRGNIYPNLVKRQALLNKMEDAFHILLQRNVIYKEKIKNFQAIIDQHQEVDKNLEQKELQLNEQNKSLASELGAKLTSIQSELTLTRAAVVGGIVLGGLATRYKEPIKERGQKLIDTLKKYRKALIVSGIALATGGITTWILMNAE